MRSSLCEKKQTPFILWPVLGALAAAVAAVLATAGLEATPNREAKLQRTLDQLVAAGAPPQELPRSASCAVEAAQHQGAAVVEPAVSHREGAAVSRPRAPWH